MSDWKANDEGSQNAGSKEEDVLPDNYVWNPMPLLQSLYQGLNPHIFFEKQLHMSTNDLFKTH